jgi:SH3-like domain-containing protein
MKSTPSQRDTDGPHRYGPALCAFLAALVASAALAAGLKVMSVEVREGRVRTSPSFLGKVRGTLRYAERVEILEDGEAWLRVRAREGKMEGWVHRTALTRKRIVMRAGGRRAAVKASSDEVALAGKGFNAQVEAKYKSNHRDISYIWIDRMETFRISEDEMAAFLREGKVYPPGSAGR